MLCNKRAMLDFLQPVFPPAKASSGKAVLARSLCPSPSTLRRQGVRDKYASFKEMVLTYKDIFELKLVPPADLASR
jgi:hypothetical protein